MKRGGVISNFSLTVEANGGNWNGNTSQTIRMGQTTEIENPTKTDYVFVGWIIEGIGSSINGTKFTMGAADTTITAQWVKEVEPFYYTGAGKKWTAPATGYYKIELWGAQGGQGLQNGVLANIPGKGGYTKGLIYLIKEEELYIYVGGIGQNATVASGGAGGYNGGGKGGTDTQDNDDSGGGGGATDIRYFSETPSMEDLKWDSTKGLNSRIMVAAGGGGSTYYNNGAAGGGLVGINDASKYGAGGTQTTGTAFGKGGTGVNAIGVGGGGGGSGYYGGFGGPSDGMGGGGGSGYIGSSALQPNKRYMYCYGCTESSNDTTYTISTTGTSSLRDTVNCPIGYSEVAISKCAKSGNGAAKLTYIGETLN